MFYLLWFISDFRGVYIVSYFLLVLVKLRVHQVLVGSQSFLGEEKLKDFWCLQCYRVYCYSSFCFAIFLCFLQLQAYVMRPSIIFFDEIDGLAPVRSSRQDQIHR